MGRMGGKILGGAGSAAKGMGVGKEFGGMMGKGVQALGGSPAALDTAVGVGATALAGTAAVGGLATFGAGRASVGSR